MTAAPSLLHAGRLRIAAGLAGLALVAAMGALRQPPRQGLVLYVTSDGAAALADSFSRTSGVPVTTVRLSTGPMLARIAAEADRPRWALAWVDGDVAAAALDRAGLLEHGIVPPADWTPTGRGLLPSSGAWVPIGVTLAGVSLSRPGGTGPVGMPDPSISGPAFPEIAGLVSQAGGWPGGRSALVAMRSSGLSVAPTSPAVVEELRAGRIASALIQSSTAYAVAARDPALRVHTPHTAYLMPGVVMMAKGLPTATRRDARRLIGFLVSREANRARLAMKTTDRFFWPVIKGVPSPAGLPPLTSIKVVHLEPYRWAPLQAEITAWFGDRIARR